MAVGLAGFVDGAFDVGFVAHIECEGQGLAAGGLDLSGDTLQTVAVDIDEGDGGALLSEAFADGGADAGCATGNHRGRIFEFHRRLPSCSLRPLG